MTVQTAREATQITPISFATDAEQIARAVNERLLALLEQLQPADWEAPTECPGWTVSDMVGHIIGAAKAGGSFRETVRQQLWAMRHKGEYDGNDLDATNALQVRDHQGLTPSDRVEALRAALDKAVAGRMHFPRPLRRIRVTLAPTGSTAEGMPSSLTLGHLMEVIYTRDVWLHHVDIARATGRPLPLDEAVDGRIVEDVVREWAGRHNRPFELVLTGPAGGVFRQGERGPRLEHDAVEFCRALSGRAPADGLLAFRVLF